jgi:hypothetical protein
MRKLLAVFTVLLLTACAGPARQPDAPETHPYFAAAAPPAPAEAPQPEVKPEDCAVHVYRNRTAFYALNTSMSTARSSPCSASESRIACDFRPGATRSRCGRSSCSCPAR